MNKEIITRIRELQAVVSEFISGAWKTNPRAMDIDLTHGGNTRIL